MVKNSIQKILIVVLTALIGFSHIVTARDNQVLSQELSFQDSSLSDNTGASFQNNINGKNVIFSLLLPGLGEWIAGEKGRAKIFMVAELALWASYFGSREYANVIKNDYHTFAAVHAGVDTRKKDKQYWIDIGNSPGIYQFNERRRIQRNLEATYPETDRYFWQWDSGEHRIEYTELRDKEENWKRTATFMIGGMVLNRIISAIDIVRLIRKEKKSQGANRYSYLFWDYSQNKWQGEVVRLNLTLRF